MSRFILDGCYGAALERYGIRVEEALRNAELPGDAFRHKTPTMKEEEYFRFLDAVSELITDPETPVQIACADGAERFSPPIFACYCSKNGEICIERLARYKRLIGPMRFVVDKTDAEIGVELTTEDGVNELPRFLVETEFAFLVGILRKATREAVSPLSVTMKSPVTEKAFSDFLTVPVTRGDKNRIAFSRRDCRIPFISYDEAMWSYFEPEMNKRLADLDVDESVGARVRSALTELLPGGASGMGDVAAKLGLSRRTLQRKLEAEHTTFQKQLNGTRELLAIHYIRNTDMSANDIAYLLGYQEVNSFLRAFAIWTGMSVSEYRKTR